MSELLHDIRHIARSLLRAPTFALTAIVTFAIGIAANVTIFAVLDAALLRPLPFEEPSRLVHIAEVTPDDLDFSVSEPNYLDFRAQQRTLTDLAALRYDAFDLVDHGEPVRLRGAAVSASFFDVLGVAPVMGRVFTAAEDVAGADDVVVISHALWTERFGGDRAIVNKTVQLSGRPRTVIGIMPAGFALGEDVLWVPLAANAGSDRSNHWLDMIGRLAPGASMGATEADLAGISTRIAAVHPEIRGWSVRAQPLTRWIVGSDISRGVWLMMGAVGLLLLLACANVGNLFLARSSTRQGEFAVRAALGAGRGDLVRHLLVEAGIVALSGAIVGMLISTWAVAAVAAYAPAHIPRLAEVTIDAKHALFALTLTIGAALLFGLAPARRAGRSDLQALLRPSARAGTTPRAARMRESLVVAQVALAMILLLGSGLLLGNFLKLRSTDAGFDTRNLLAIPLELTSSSYSMNDGTMSIFFQTLTSRVAALPGVSAAGAITAHPFTTWRTVNDATPVDRAAITPPSGYLQADWRVVTSGYFAAADVPLLRGRLFEPTDTYDRPGVAVVTRTFAERMWPERDAVGQEFYWGGVDGDPIRVIGIVGDVRDIELDETAPPMMFLSTRQMSMPMMTLLVRTASDVEGMSNAIRAAVWSIDPTLPVPVVGRVSDARHAALSTPRMNTSLLMIFAALALLVATVGIYALVSCQVAARRREFGIRVALGARYHRLLRLVLVRQALLISAGLVIGGMGAVAMSGVIGELVSEGGGADVRLAGAAGLLLLVSGMVAAWIPARRTAAADPNVALRAD